MSIQFIHQKSRLIFIQPSKKPKIKSPDPVESSFVDFSKSLTTYIGQKKDDGEAQSTLKFNYIWQNLDNLFQQMDQVDVNELNLKFITLAMEKINSKP